MVAVVKPKGHAAVGGSPGMTTVALLLSRRWDEQLLTAFLAPSRPRLALSTLSRDPPER